MAETPEGNAECLQTMFRVRASEPSWALIVTVTDRFGRVYAQAMERPKALFHLQMR